MCTIDNGNVLDISVTPSRKRKRDEVVTDGNQNISQIEYEEGGQLNLAFSSTPKKKIIFHKDNSFQHMETKSIAELANQQTKINNNSENPYEVTRKPPKKKKKPETEELCCFTNPALNLDAPDKKFNPFEVKRLSPPRDSKESTSNCFINSALNIKAKDSNLNPYEILRTKSISVNQKNGIENQALESNTLMIGLPFQPTVGCRIDFQNLTPSKLLSENLIFSPVNPRIASLRTPKRKIDKSLSVISEELDIGKELDFYQLELENSINEAKLRKKINDSSLLKLKEISSDKGKKPDYDIQIKENETKNFILQPYETKETIYENETKEKNSIVITAESIVEENNVENKNNSNEQSLKDSQYQIYLPNIIIGKNNNDNIDLENYIELDKFKGNAASKEDYSHDLSNDSFDEIDFKVPAPFVRCYKKPQTTSNISDEDSSKENKSKNKVTYVIRKSLRKLLPPTKTSVAKSASSEDLKKKESISIFSSIRRSLRRPTSKLLKKTEETVSLHEISILDLSDRKIFKSNTNQSDDKNYDEDDDKKFSLRGTFRKTTKDIRNQVLKSVLKKNVEEYNLKK